METKIIRSEKFSRYMMVGHFYEMDDLSIFKQEMNTFIKNKENVLLDISRLTFLSSRGLGVFVSTSQDFSTHNLKCLLYCPREEIIDTIKISGVDMVVQTAETEEDINAFFE